MEGKTVVAIAHRLSTIAAMDRLIVLDQGRIVEEGDHRSLLAHGGLYARLWAHQSGGFLGDEPEDEPIEAPPIAAGEGTTREATRLRIGHDRLTGSEPDARSRHAPASRCHRVSCGLLRPGLP